MNRPIRAARRASSPPPPRGPGGPPAMTTWTTCRRGLFPLLAAASLALAAPARAGEVVAYSQEAFEAAQKAGKPILVAVSAPWCPICKAQKPILARLAAEPRFRDLTIFDIDFDGRKALLRTLDIRMQSTLVAYKGATETGRSVGETQPEWIEGLVETTL